MAPVAIGSHLCAERIDDQITTPAQQPSRSESSQKIRLNAARVQSTSEILTWTPPPCPPPPPSPAPAALPSPRRLELRAAPALFGPAGRLQQPRGALTSKSVFLRRRASRTRSRTRPPPHHCRRCRISESYFSRSPEVGKWAWRRFLLGSLEPCRRVASLIPSSPVSPFHSERSEGSVAPALLVAFVLCRRSCNRAALWLIGCLCCVTGLSMKSCE